MEADSHVMDEPKADEQPEVIKTEVTSVAIEEAKTGLKVPLPSAQDMVSRISVSFIQDLMQFTQIFDTLSTRGKSRVTTAILQLPQDDMPVNLVGEKEKVAFALGQRLIQSRFLLIQHYISEEMRKQKEKESEEKLNADKKENI